MRLAALIALAASCSGGPGTDGVAPGDGGASDAALDASVDAAPDDGRPVDASACACEPFEVCAAGECGCESALCGTGGFATFPVAAPSERALAPRSEVVDDGITGLSWERAMDGIWRTHADAIERCAALTLDGHDDWRLPARIELATILDASRTPTLDGDVFGAAVADYVWTASVDPSGAPRAFAIYFGQGETILAAAELAGAHVRCVRGAREPAPPRRLEGDWLVDPGAGLEWSVPLDAATTLEGARLACEARGARVPTLYELHSLVDEGRAEPATDARLEEPDATVWSTTERDLGEVLAWVMDFREGTSDLRGVDEAIAARCVRPAP